MTGGNKVEGAAIAHRYIAMCDVLGFADLVKNPKVGPEELLCLYEELLWKARKHAEYEKVTAVKGGPLQREPSCVEYTVFSDTLLVWVHAEPGPCAANDWIGVFEFFRLVSTLIAESVGTQMPLRVGVAYGECYIDRERGIHLGAPIVDAYQTERAQEWIGGACHRTCFDAPHWGTIGAAGAVMRYRVPLKHGKKAPSRDAFGELNHAINWANMYDQDTFNSARTWLVKKECEARRPDIKRKYANTLGFLERVTRGSTEVQS